MKQELLDSCLKLKNGIITYSRAGGGAGSILLIATNTNISLWIWCYWEIKKAGTILANADDDTTAMVGKIAVASRQLEGKRISKVELAPLYYDLHIFLEDDYELVINCESQPEGEDYPLNNWELSLEDLNITYIVTCDFKIRKDTFR